MAAAEVVEERKRKRHDVRFKVVSVRLGKTETALMKALYPETPYLAEPMPKTLGECEHAARPCLHVGCKYNLYLDVNPTTGSIKLNFPTLDPDELKETCAMDVAKRGGATLEDVGSYMNITRERIRQLEVKALKLAKRNASIQAVSTEDRLELASGEGYVAHLAVRVIGIRKDLDPEPQKPVRHVTIEDVPKDPEKKRLPLPKSLEQFRGALEQRTSEKPKRRKKQEE